MLELPSTPSSIICIFAVLALGCGESKYAPPGEKNLAGGREADGKSATQTGGLVAVDGSETSIDAARAGLALLADDAPIVIVTVVETSDPTLVTGSGIAGGVMSAEELDVHDEARVAEG